MPVANMYGPDATFLGVPAADLEDPASYAGAGAVVVGAPFDGGTSHRACWGSTSRARSTLCAWLSRVSTGTAAKRGSPT